MNDDTSILDHGDTRVLDADHRAAAQVRDYVSAVRRHLQDLDPEDLDDLTSGMHADLAELLAERGGRLEAILGSPARYAAELRSAAGIPERSSPLPRALDLAAIRRDASERLMQLRSRWPWIGPTWAFIVTLRPAWWVLRGLLLTFVWRWVVGDPTRELIPSAFFDWFVAACLVVASVWWARRPQRSRPAVLLTSAANVVAVFGLLGVLYMSAPRDYSGPAPSWIPNGLFLDGNEIRNIYVYDADGKRLTDVRLFDDQGHPVVPYPVDFAGADVAARVDRYGTSWTNVFPRPWLAGLPPWVFTSNAEEGWTPPWVPPQVIAPLAPLAPVSPSPSPSASLTPSPSASPTTAPSGTRPATTPSTGSAKPTSAPATGAKTTAAR